VHILPIPHRLEINRQPLAFTIKGGSCLLFVMQESGVAVEIEQVGKLADIARLAMFEDMALIPCIIARVMCAQVAQQGCAMRRLWVARKKRDQLAHSGFGLGHTCGIDQRFFQRPDCMQSAPAITDFWWQRQGTQAGDNFFATFNDIAQVKIENEIAELCYVRLVARSAA
jgi:hypothetical protein